jgi:hypothetical protein
MPVFQDGPAVDYDSRWLFFSEDDISIQLTPPYFHKTKASEYATVLSGEFNISKWFRPIIPTFSLWKSSKELVLSEEDPLAYVNFITDKKVVLQEFKETTKIKSIMHECVLMKDRFPNLPLSENYNRFVLNKKHKALIEEIKNRARLNKGKELNEQEAKVVQSLHNDSSSSSNLNSSTDANDVVDNVANDDDYAWT